EIAGEERSTLSLCGLGNWWRVGAREFVSQRWVVDSGGCGGARAQPSIPVGPGNLWRVGAREFVSRRWLFVWGGGAESRAQPSIPVGLGICGVLALASL